MYCAIGPRPGQQITLCQAGGTYSRAGRTTMGPGRFTAVFGMGTGVSDRVWPPALSGPRRPPGPGRGRADAGRRVRVVKQAVASPGHSPPLFWGGRGGCGGSGGAAKRSAVSTGWLSVLPHVHARPIDLVVYEEPSLFAGRLI